MTATPQLAPAAISPPPFRICAQDECQRESTRHGRYCARCGQARRRRHPKYVHSLASDQAIRVAYRQLWETHDRRAIAITALRLGWPSWVVKKRAQALGLARTSDKKPWMPEEEKLLLKIAHHSDAVISLKLREAGFHRTETAVHLKLKRERIRKTLDGFSAHQLAEAFGVDGHKITRWIAAGILKAERREQARTPQQGGNAFWIRHADVKAFVFRYPEEIDLKTVEKSWFLDILTDGRICR